MTGTVLKVDDVNIDEEIGKMKFDIFKFIEKNVP